LTDAQTLQEAQDQGTRAAKQGHAAEGHQG
jgi:hypothetical protein